MKLTRQERSWILYDVACSAFTMVISTIIPIYFASLTAAANIPDNLSTAYWGYATSISTLIMALLAPILGAIADYEGMKKKLFTFFLCIGVVMALSLSFVQQWAVYLGIFVLAKLGYSACNVFYDSMLVDVTSNERMDRVSSYGFAWGYIGSCIPFIAGILFILITPFGMSTAMATQIAVALSVVWWAVLTGPLLKNVRQTHCLENRNNKVSDAFRRLFQTLRTIRKNKPLFYFILAYFFYIDGVYTIISMATKYGDEVGIDSTHLILALLLTQIVAFPFAIWAGRLAEKWGSLRLIKVFIAVYAAVCLFAIQLDKPWEFWLLAVIVGMAQGGIQSLSRSYYGKMVPKEESNEYFGFFDIFGKFADFFGPLLLAVVSTATGRSNYGVSALVVLFIVGFILLSRIPSHMEQKQ